MNESLIIAEWWVLFAGTHLLLSSAWVRPKLVSRWGQRPFQGLYSLVAFATLIPLCVYYARHKHAGPQLWVTLEPYLLARDLNIVFMVLAFILLLSGLIARPPSSMLAQGRPQAYGITRITRHPTFAAFFLFGLAHFFVVGSLGDVAFFGGFVVFGWIGARHQDARLSHSSRADTDRLPSIPSRGQSGTYLHRESATRLRHRFFRRHLARQVKQRATSETVE